MSTKRELSRRRRRMRLLVGSIGVIVLGGCVVAEDDAASPGITSPPATDPTVVPISGPATTNPNQPQPTVTVAPRSCAQYETNQDLPLKLCDKGELVQSVQAEVARVLRSDLEADGFFGPGTEAAVIRFQTSVGLVPDGLVGPTTWNELFGSVLSTSGSTRGIAVDWYGQSAADAIAALDAQGFVVIDYEVCSSSVEAGEVRQIIGGDGTIYLDTSGVTDEGQQVPIGEVIEVKIGSGTSC